MPEATADDENKTDSPARIVGWWQKFHFSGRVIMCSVLFGLGLVLIGGLILAINMNDDSKLKDQENHDAMPTKPPSNYVGPVVMGIGGFIVIVGVIMCLFETQVCRKKTADARPLISGTSDDAEGKVLDPEAIPSSPRSHKNHKHKSRKASASPRKSKSRHVKSHSRDKNSSSKSPAISIEKSKGFLSSNEDKFLTPPNTLDAHAAPNQTNACDAENQTSASLMKSFTSSGPSWNQSTEFLTPATSFKDTSSLENSIDVDEKQGQVNFMTTDFSENENSPEYMTPLTVEEDRIQKLFVRVKNEQMEITKRQMEEKDAALKVNSGHGNNVANSSQPAVDVDKGDTEISDDAEKVTISTEKLPSTILSDTLTSNKTRGHSAELHIEIEETKSNHEESSICDKLSLKNNEEISALKDDKKIKCEPSDIKEQEDEKRKVLILGNEKQDSLLLHDSQGNEENNASDSILRIETSNIKNDDNDLESSVSSDETIVPRDPALEKLKKNEMEENTKSSVMEEISSDESKAPNISESPENTKSDKSDKTASLDTSSNNLPNERVESDLNLCEKVSNVEKLSAENSR